MIEPLGTQLWADIRWREGWRVQRRWNQNSARLLDPAGRAVVHGPTSRCELALDRCAPAARPASHLVVLLHGLGRTRRSLARLDRALFEAGFVTARLDYPSTRCTIDEHARVVGELLERVPTPKRLSFVGHSLGALVTRRVFAAKRPWRAAAARVVMLAPPNQGASLATSLSRHALPRRILGPSFLQIAAGQTASLPVPDVPIAIFAGDALGTWGDGVVKVAETRLDAMVEHHVVPAIHTLIMNHPDVVPGVVSFLRATPHRR